MSEIDDYLASVPPAQRAALEHVRAIVARAAPDAAEGRSYGMPAFRLHDRPLVGFTANKQHLSLHPFSPDVVDAVRGDLEGFDLSPAGGASSRMEIEPMSSDRSGSLRDMTNSTQAPTTVRNIGVAMFTVSDQDAALAFYTEKLGFEVRADVRFGEEGDMRWLEVAPPGSRARLALNPPMNGSPGGGSIGVETPDVLGEHARLAALGGIDVDPEPMRSPGAPLMFMLRDPDGNNVVVVQEDPSAA